MDQDCLPTAYRKNMLKVARRRACPLVESGYWDRENVVTRPGPQADYVPVRNTDVADVFDTILYATSASPQTETANAVHPYVV